MKEQDRLERQATSVLELTTEGAEEDDILPTNESERVSTQVLAKAYSWAKDPGRAEKAAREKDNYALKLSAVAHRRAKQAWEVTIILIALYSVLVIPLRIAVNTTLMDPIYDPIDLVTWLIYVADLRH